MQESLPQRGLAATEWPGIQAVCPDISPTVARRAAAWDMSLDLSGLGSQPDKTGVTPRK